MSVAAIDNGVITRGDAMRFSIHDLFLVTVIVALAVGWWVDSSRLHSQLRSERLRQIGQQIGVYQALKVSPLNSSAPIPNPSKP